jgi:putative glycosyltransferase (TIGR04372 family)
MSFTTMTVRLGTRRVLVAHPNERQYGHLGLEIVMSLARARKADADVYLVRPSTALGVGLFELESPQVRLLRPTPVVRELLRACISWRKLRDRLDKWRETIREQVEREFVHEVSRYVGDPGMPQPVREGLRGARRRLRASLEQAVRDRAHRPAYYERRLLREPVPVRLNATASEEAAAQARAHGIAGDARLVCIHARESGYKQGREIQDRKPQRGQDDRARNARIESYFEAVDYLVGRGYTVVRLGDPTMTPVCRRGVVDLATSPMRTNLIEVYCLLRSDLLIAGESGMVGITCVTNTPFLCVNATEPISAYPVRSPGLFLPKAVVDKRDGRRLGPLDLLTPDYQRYFRDDKRYLYIDNSPGDIRDATCEMIEWLDGRWTESSAQRGYHEAIMRAAARLRRRFTYARKWGLHEGFLGDGRIARIAVAATSAPMAGVSEDTPARVGAHE